MNFFAAQDRARRTSRHLIIAYAVATALIVFGVTAIIGLALFVITDQTYVTSQVGFLAQHMPLLSGVAMLTALFIIGASLYRTASLSGGGGAVAAAMGGTLVATDAQDPLRRRLRNIVEEMAIASGVPVPEIYVLEAESGINAFAAGYSPGDAAIAVTRGALQLLDRDELQGVIGHEFSHILNGDMRLNIRLMGILFGIMALGLAGRLILRGVEHARGRGAAAVVIVGGGLAVLGAIGVFSARVIKAGVSRQREYLADASAVQFTRQTDGIANALKKIGGYTEGSTFKAADAEEVSHMLFGAGAGLRGMLATHPPLVDRIRALDPGFTAADFPMVDPRAYRGTVDDDAPLAQLHPGTTSAAASGGDNRLVDSIADTVGEPDSEHVAYATRLRRSIPASLYAAAHSQELAYLLVIALVLDRTGRHLDRQLALAREQLGTERTRLLRRYYDELTATGAEFRLPLLAVAFPALRLRPAQHLSYLLELTARLIEVDEQVDLYEYCFHRVLSSNLASDRRLATRTRSRPDKNEMRRAAIRLLRVLAEQGHDSPADRKAAFAAGTATLGTWAQDQVFDDGSPRAMSNTVEALNRSLDVLLGLRGADRSSLIRAIGAVAAHDGRLAVAEAELIRAVCATLDCPLPPILVKSAQQ